MCAPSTGEQDLAMNQPQQGVTERGDTPDIRWNDSGFHSEPATELAPSTDVERFSVVVIGGGQAGLAAGYHLAQRGIDFVILEKGARLGESWRRRWDSLRLFTPARYDGLPGWPFPGDERTYPTKDQMADYLEKYAERFRLPVRLGIDVLGLTRNERGLFVVECADRNIESDQVIVATGAHATQRTPSFAADLDPQIIQLHAGEYRNPSQLQEGGVLVVGAGNSGSEIAIESAQAGHRTWLAGRSTGQVSPAAYSLDGRLFWFVANHVLTVGTPFGRRARKSMLSHGGLLINLTREDVIRAGVELTPRVASVLVGRPQLDDGRCLDVANVVWCTGFEHDFSWIRLPVLDAHGMPRHERGVLPSEPGLYFVGLPFLTRFASALVGGAGRDAGEIVEHAARALSPVGRLAAESPRFEHQNNRDRLPQISGT